MITCSGGEVLDWSSYFPVEIPEALRPLPPPREGAKAGGTPGARARATTPAVRDGEPSIEDRLRRVEDKLDRLIEKLGDGPRR